MRDRDYQHLQAGLALIKSANNSHGTITPWRGAKPYSLFTTWPWEVAVVTPRADEKAEAPRNCGPPQSQQAVEAG